VFLLGQRGDAEAADLLIDVARSDADPDVRSDAVLWLSRMPGDRPVATLEELLRASDDERMQRAAVRALAASASPRARQVLRALIERGDAPERLRSDAITYLVRDEGAGDDAAYLRALYGRLESPRLRERVISAVARSGAEGERWLLALARSRDEPLELRAAALARAGRLSVPVAELARTYDALPERELREQLIGAFARRREPEATDKLLDIARGDADPRLRRAAISALTRKNDPRTTKLLMEILDR
jgi:HEAT repeat protein